MLFAILLFGKEFFVLGSWFLVRFRSKSSEPTFRWEESVALFPIRMQEGRQRLTSATAAMFILGEAVL